MVGGHDACRWPRVSATPEFAFDTMQATMVAKGQLKAGQLKHVWTSEMIAGSPAVMNTATIDADTQAKIKEAFKTKANKPALVAGGFYADEKSCKLPEHGLGYPGDGRRLQRHPRGVRPHQGRRLQGV